MRPCVRPCLKCVLSCGDPAGGTQGTQYLFHRRYEHVAVHSDFFPVRTNDVFMRPLRPYQRRKHITTSENSYKRMRP